MKVGCSCYCYSGALDFVKMVHLLLICKINHFTNLVQHPLHHPPLLTPSFENGKQVFTVQKYHTAPNFQNSRKKRLLKTNICILQQNSFIYQIIVCMFWPITREPLDLPELLLIVSCLRDNHQRTYFIGLHLWGFSWKLAHTQENAAKMLELKNS